MASFGACKLELHTFVLPEQLLGMIAEAFESDAQPCQAFEDTSLCAAQSVIVFSAINK